MWDDNRWGYRLCTVDSEGVKESFMVKEMKTWNWAEQVLRITRRTNESVTYINTIIYVNSDVLCSCRPMKRKQGVKVCWETYWV